MPNIYMYGSSSQDWFRRKIIDLPYFRRVKVMFEINKSSIDNNKLLIFKFEFS